MLEKLTVNRNKSVVKISAFQSSFRRFDPLFFATASLNDPCLHFSSPDRTGNDQFPHRPTSNALLQAAHRNPNPTIYGPLIV